MKYYIYVADNFINFYKVKDDNPVFMGMQKIKKSTYDFCLSRNFDNDPKEVERADYVMFSVYL